MIALLHLSFHSFYIITTTSGAGIATTCSFQSNPYISSSSKHAGQFINSFFISFSKPNYVFKSVFLSFAYKLFLESWINVCNIGNTSSGVLTLKPVRKAIFTEQKISCKTDSNAPRYESIISFECYTPK